MFTDPDSKVSENNTPAAAEVLALDELLELERELEIELLERDVETELLEREIELERELLERDVETELLEREVDTELLEREVDAALDVAPQPVPVTAGTSAAPALFVPCTPNSIV